MSKSVTDRTGELLSARRRARLAYMNSEIDFLAWVHERRLIMTEAEVLGLTDEMLARAGEVADDE